MKKIGCTIPEYFAQYGEEEFRKRDERKAHIDRIKSLLEVSYGE